MFVAGGLASGSAAVAAAPVAASTQAAIAVACDSPPDSPDATAANRNRFVSLWSARFADHDWLTSYAKLKTTPSQIIDEGFHAMSEPVKVWLESCLLDDLLRTAGKTATSEQRQKYLVGEHMLIFGKAKLNELRENLTDEPSADKPAPPPPSPGAGATAQGLQDMSDALTGAGSFTSADQAKSSAQAPVPTVDGNVTGPVSDTLKSLIHNGQGTPKSTTFKAAAAPSLVPTGLEPNPITQIPLVPQLLAAVDALLQLISAIQGVLFTLPVVNLLASAFYKICAQSATMPLKCSISLPVGIPIPADVTGDNIPDVLGWLAPVTNLIDVGARFQVTRLCDVCGNLPAHVFAVYDTPIVKKRIEFGFDGRASSLPFNTTADFSLKNVVQAITGDIQVAAQVDSSTAGKDEALTFAVKDLVGGSIGVPPSEENPLAGSVQMVQMPSRFNVNARFTHNATKDQDTFNITSTSATKVNAMVDQRTTTTTPKSKRIFTASIDKMPTSVTVDLTHQGEKQVIDYTASAPINSVTATDTATPNVADPGSFTQSQYAVTGVPTHVNVAMQGSQDILYTANAKIPEVSFSTKTLATNVLQQEITAKAHDIPKSVHVTNLTTPDSQAVTYDADSNLADVELGMYDKSEAGDETNLVAKATSIPTHLAFSQLKSTGVYDLSANQGIGLIEASLTRNGGAILPLPGKDHATVKKVGTQLGLDFRLTGFKSAHFDGHKDTTVALGLDPGGQSFDAIADLDDPNILATAHIDALPSSVQVNFDPATGHATYTADRVIPELDASFDDRGTHMHGDARLTGLPKQIALTFNTSGAVPQVTYDADSRLTSINLNYLEKPGGLAIHGLINDLPKYMKAGGINPIVFDARTGSGDAPASSDIGQILFQFGTDGTFASPPTTDDHAYLDTDTVNSTHAELLYHGLRFISVDTSGQQLHASIKNTAARLFRAYLTTPTLTLTGFIDKVPAEIDVAQVGNKITYDASSTINEISTDLNRSNGDHVAVDINSVPKNIAVTFDGANSHLSWAASSVAGGVSALAHLTPATIGGTRAFDAGLTITDIPTAWSADWVDGNVGFVTNGTGIGSIDAKVTNHTSVHSLAGDHLNAFFDQPNGNLDASLHISNLQTISYNKITDGNGGGFEAKLNMGTHGQLNFGANVTLNSGARLIASGAFNHLPSVIDLKSDGGQITYDGDDNPDLTVSVAAAQSAAALAATPFPTMIHGVSVRDGQDGSGNRGVRANLRITGLPDHLDLNSPAGTYEVNGFHPSDPNLGVDVKLTTLAPQPLTLELNQVIPTATPVNFKFGPFTSDTAGDGTHNLNLDYTSNQDLGPLTAEVTYGNTDDAKLDISEIPQSINVHASLGTQKDVGITMAHGISDITASYKKVGDIDFAASVHLHDIPSAVNLHLGRNTAPDGTVSTPDFVLTASQAGLDIDAAATAAITSPADINAAATLAIVNMGKTVTGQLDGTTLKITSAPATQKFALGASAQIHKDFNLDFSAGPLTNTGSLGVNLDIHQLTLGFENASSLQLDLGIATGLKGDFSSFTFGIDSTTKIDLKDKVHVVFENPIDDIDIDIFDINVHVNLQNIIDHFRIASNTLANIFSIRLVDIGLGYCDFAVKVRPHAEFSTSGSSFTLGPPPNDGSNPPAWIITPDPNFLGVTVPDFIVDIVMFFTSPYDNEIHAGVDCESRL